MWLHQEVLSKMFIENVEDQRQELLKARKTNADLKNKSDYLQSETNMFKEKLNLNQVAIVTGKNELNHLQEEIRAQRKLNMELTQRLRIFNEEIEASNHSIEETNALNNNSLMVLEPIRENLDFKSNVVECLEKKLTESRLNSAEQEELITELYRNYYASEKDMEALKLVKPSSVSKLQQELLDAKLKEADVMLECKKLKRTISTLKEEVLEKISESEQENNDSSDEYFTIKFNTRDKIQGELKHAEEISLANTIKLQDKVDYLRIQIKKLENIKKDIQNQISLNEENKVHLHSVRASLHYRINKISQEIEEEKEKYKKLETSTNQELDRILKSITDKTYEISQLNEKIEEMKAKVETRSKENIKAEYEITESVSLHLNKKIELLNCRIEELTSN